jgi:large conductance mechanosensitive channel
MAAAGILLMLEEFKKFAMRGNVIDLAVGVIIGAAFGAIVNSLVNDLIMPIIGAVTGGLDFSNYYAPLSSKVQAGASYTDAKKQGAVLGWGQFLTAFLNFLIIAWVLFISIKGINKLKVQDPTASQQQTPEAALLTEIRDLLKSSRPVNGNATAPRP